MADAIIAMRGVSKRYTVFDSQWSRLRHALLPGAQAGAHDVWALRDVDFEVARGEAIAVIGRNGGGKSTLLEILAGTLEPTSGEVRVGGRVSALLELGSGFNPEYTGRDNVILNGMLLGLTRAEVLRRFGEIEAFAEIGDAIDRPVKTYSSGMVMRLAFAVQVVTNPEILVIDEALSVGDFFFQQKCFSYIRTLCERGVTLVFVSHDMRTVRDLCARAIYLREGRVRFQGATHLAIKEYMAESAPTRALAAATPGEADVAPSGELEQIVRDAAWRSAGPPVPGKLIAVALYDDEGRPAAAFRMGSVMTVKVAYHALDGAPVHVMAAIRNKYDQVVSSTGSSRLGLEPPAGGEPLVFEMRMKLMLEAGSYSLTATLSNLVAPNQGANLDASDPIGPIAVKWNYDEDRAPFLGMFGLEVTGRFSRVDPAVGEER